MPEKGLSRKSTLGVYFSYSGIIKARLFPTISHYESVKSLEYPISHPSSFEFIYPALILRHRQKDLKWVLYSTLDTGKGNDIITGTGSLLGIENFYSTIDTGGGSDTITGIATDNAGILNFGLIYIGDGNDIITGTSMLGIGIENYENGTIDTGDISTSNQGELASFSK
jgi:hypothetical protein